MGERVDETDARAYVGTSARDCIADLRDLQTLARVDDYEQGEKVAGLLDRGRIESLGLDPDGFDGYNAEEAMDGLALAVERTTMFEVVLGCGGPTRVLCFECDGSPANWQPDPHTPPPTVYEIRRVCFRYSWSGSAELELFGTDREVAEAFARRVISDLA